MKKHVIMLLTNSFDPDVRVYKEAKYLISKGFLVSILCWDKDLLKNYPETEDIDEINIIRFKIPSAAGSGKKQIPAFLKYIRTCSEYLKNNDYDYLHCNDLDGAIAGYLSNKKKKPSVFDMHEYYENGTKSKRFVIRKAVTFLLKRSIAGLYENAAYLGDNYSTIHDRLYPLRNYPDSNLIECLPKSKSDKFRVAYHGVVRSQIPEFTALFEAASRMKDVRVDINGGGIDLQKLKELEQQYQDKADVHVNGPYNGTKESSILYGDTDVLFCGYSPNNPNYQGDAEVIKFYEAICTGTPMIMTEATGMAAKIKQYGYGLVCDTRNPDEIEKAIRIFMNNPEFLKECSSNELNNSYKYDWNNAVKVLDEIYRKE